MKKSYIKLVIFNVLLIVILLLNNFISNILNYKNIMFGLIVILFLYKYIFGFEKDNHRFMKDIAANIIIILLSFFIIYYLLGLIIGFVRTTNYYSVEGFRDLIIPYIAVIIMKEFLRYQVLCKTGDNKKLIALSFITFTLIDISGAVSVGAFKSNYELFMLFSITVLPAISRNIACSYISRKMGYKPNIIWVLAFGLYGVLLPIVPNTGIYIGSMINFLFPIVILYNVFSFFNIRKNEVPLRDKKIIGAISLPILIIFVLTVIYFTSGYFRYYTIAIASGSMKPNINKGDVVIIDQKSNIKNLKKGDIIAYKYNNRIIVHRIVNIEKPEEELYIYTKGDANNAKDDYIVYEKTIIGVVNYKVPFMGLPTIWINEL